MSDDYMDKEDYGFEYEDDEGEEPDVDLENQYYNSKAKKDHPQEALTSFQRVVDMEGSQKGEWGFKALKEMVKIYFKLNEWDMTLKTYKELLSYIKSAVTRNYSEKSINNILDHISAAKNMAFMENFYEATLYALEEAKNDRLWFKTNLKLAQLWLDRKEYNRMLKILRQLHYSCRADDGDDDPKKGTQILEVYALEIQMYTIQKNIKKLKDLYQRSLRVKSAIPHPKIMGIVRECGGKMHMSEGEWEKALVDFFEAFKNYDEAGSPRRIQCLKYLVLANMLMMSEINPFDSQETKPYKNNPNILAMTNLVVAYQKNEIHEFEKILKDYIENLLRNIRTQVLIKLIRPYTRLELSFISKELNIPETDVESLIVALILDGKIHGKVDQVNHRLELTKTIYDTKSYIALEKWAIQLEKVQQTCLNKIT